MVGFGHKTAWLAIRDGAPDSVLVALGARPEKDVTWRSGLDRAYVSDDCLVATPPLPGAHDSAWMLVTGRRLLLREHVVDPVGLSEQLGTEVQCFASDRVSEYHRWTRAVKGILVRSFAYLGASGEILGWFGDPDGIEQSIGLRDTAPDDERTVLIGQDDVMRVAASWSIDPTSLDGLPAPGPLRLGRVVTQ